VTGKAIVLRRAANQDVENIIDHYAENAGAAVANDFIDALEQGYAHIARNPGTGSPRYGHRLELPGLRTWPLIRFPYLVFYFEADAEIDIWHVLHGAMDLPEWLDT
jgi:toxin ParE1/3/4